MNLHCSRDTSALSWRHVLEKAWVLGSDPNKQHGATPPCGLATCYTMGGSWRGGPMDVDNLRVTGGCVPIIKGSHFSAFLGKPMPTCWKRNNVDTMWNQRFTLARILEGHPCSLYMCLLELFFGRVSKSEGMDISWKKVYCPLWVLHFQVEDLNYLHK